MDGHHVSSPIIEIYQFHLYIVNQLIIYRPLLSRIANDIKYERILVKAAFLLKHIFSSISPIHLLLIQN